MPEPAIVDGVPYLRLEHERGTPRVVQARVAPWDGTGARAVIAPAFVGVCRSDLRELAGERAVRRDFGHEIVARVIAADPPTLQDVIAAPAVALDPHVAVERTSGFAEAVELRGTPQTLRSALRPLPSPLARARGIFVEPLACASHCVARAMGPSPAPAAVLGAGMAGTLIALGLEAAGVAVDLFNRSSDRLDLLRKQRVFAGRSLRRATDREGSYATVVVATAQLTEEALGWAFDAAADGGSVVLYAGTTPGLRVAGLDVDAIRREERHVTVGRDGTTLELIGTHGAVTADFDRAIELLARGDEDAPGARLERLLGPELRLADAVAELPRHTSRGFTGKAYVRLPADWPPTGDGRT